MRAHELDPERPDPLLGRLVSLLLDRPDVESERASSLGDGEADLSESDDPHHLPVEAVGL
jgi:hypothetical protein